MGNKKYLLFLGLVLFLVSFVSAEDSCLSDNLCSLCGDTPRLETPKSFTLKVWDNKKCIGGSDSYLNGEYELTQSSFNSCVWEHNGVGDVYTVYVWGGTDNSLSAIFYTDYGDTAYFNFDISGSCTETMEADFDSSFLCDNDNFNVVPIHNSDNVKGGHATLTSCPMSKPKIEIDFKDKYKLDTMKNRYFTPKKPVTPYDDITCKVTVDIPAGLTEEEDTQFTTDTINRFEKAKADLIVVDEDGNDFGKIVSTTKLEFSLKESVVGKKIVFVWDIPGWRQGWTFDQDMINRIVNKRKIDCVVVVGGITYNLDKPEPTSNCVLIAGPDGITKDDNGNVIPAANINFVFMNDGLTGIGPILQVHNAWKAYDGGFSKIDPFGYEAYSKNFAYKAGLKSLDYVAAPETSGCKKGNVNLIYSDVFIATQEEKMRKDPTISLTENQHVQGLSIPGTNLVYLSSNANTRDMLHEAVHSLCKAQDEANLYSSNGKLPREINCRLDGSSFAPYRDSIAGCTYPNYFKSSPDSLMNYGVSTKLNQITAGYCLNAVNKCSLDKTNPNNCWEQCKDMDVIKPAA